MYKAIRNDDILQESHTVDENLSLVNDLLAGLEISHQNLPFAFIFLPFSSINAMFQLHVLSQAKLLDSPPKVLQDFRSTSIVTRPDIGVPDVLINDAGNVARHTG